MREPCVYGEEEKAPQADKQSVQGSWGSSSMFQGEKCSWTRVSEEQLGGGEVRVSISKQAFNATVRTLLFVHMCCHSMVYNSL